MSALTERDFRRALEAVIPPQDDVVVIYSGIWTFGHRFAWDTTELPDRLLDIIDDVVGPDRTLLYPTFTSDFVQTRRYDLVRSTPIGVIPERVIHRPGVRRTRQPLHSFAVRGPRAKEVLALPCTTSWGDDGILGWMGEVNARLCPLGLPWHEACSFFHRVEKVLQVPYRYYKRFAGVLLDDGREIGACEEVKYSWSLRVRPRWDYTIVRPRLTKAKAILSGGNPLIPLESANAKSILAACIELLSENLYAYVVNVDEVKDWVAHGKADEVAELAPDEQWPQS